VSLQDFIASAQEPPPKLTHELLERTMERTMEQIKNAPTDPCRLGRHVVSATALRSDAKYARCANCYGVVQLR
jgi:hypothetical protein